MQQRIKDLFLKELPFILGLGGRTLAPDMIWSNGRAITGDGKDIALHPTRTDSL